MLHAPLELRAAITQAGAGPIKPGGEAYSLHVRRLTVTSTAAIPSNISTNVDGRRHAMPDFNASARYKACTTQGSHLSKPRPP
jgi:hypothetical protein